MLTLTLTLPSQFTAEKVILPVEVVTSISFADKFSMRTSPVLSFIFIDPEEEARQFTSPVLAEISIPLNLKPPGISILPVLSFITREAYSDSGRYTVIFGDLKEIENQ